jgi:hypothetical protein
VPLDLFEQGKVYLSLEGAEFEASHRSVTVAIPLALWDRLRAVAINPVDYWDDEVNDHDPAGCDPLPPRASATNRQKSTDPEVNDEIPPGDYSRQDH